MFRGSFVTLTVAFSDIRAAGTLVPFFAKEAIFADIIFVFPRDMFNVGVMENYLYIFRLYEYHFFDCNCPHHSAAKRAQSLRHYGAWVRGERVCASSAGLFGP